MNITEQQSKNHEPATVWNKDRILGQKHALKLKEIWEIRIRLQMDKNIRELALFNMAIDSKLRGCDLVKLRVSDVLHSVKILSRAIVIQQKHKSLYNLKSRNKPMIQYVI